MTTICPFALATGIACPGCGMTRALWALLRADPVAAWRFHPLLIVGLLEVAVLVWLARAGRRLPPAVLVGVNALALLAVWVGRLATGTLPPV